MTKPQDDLERQREIDRLQEDYRQISGEVLRLGRLGRLTDAATARLQSREAVTVRALAALGQRPQVGI
jgi:hypothetical protein